MNAITYETRRESYRKVLRSLGNRQSQVFSSLMIHQQGVTASELAKDMHSFGHFLSSDRNNVHPRLNELVELGLVRILGKRECKVTHKTVAVYQAVPVAVDVALDCIGGLA